MSRDQVRGLADAFSLIDLLPVAVRHELQDLLGRLGRDALSEQQAVVAKKTGALRGGLTSQVDVERLRTRVGIFGAKKRYGAGASRAYQDLFYARVIEGGRRAQIVVVTRRLKRRVTGNGRNGTTRKVTYTGKPYKMRVKAMAARPFISPPGVRDAADRRVADFWARTFARIDGG